MGLEGPKEAGLSATSVGCAEDSRELTVILIFMYMKTA